MARYSIRKKHSTSSDPFYDSILIQKIINQLMKKGKKTLAHKILKQTVHEIERKTQQDPIQTIEQAVHNVTPAVEIKARRIGGAVYSIPIELSSDRGVSIAIRWIINCCNKKSSQVFTIKFANEIIDCSNKIGAAIRKKEEVHKIAESSVRLM